MRRTITGCGPLCGRLRLLLVGVVLTLIQAGPASADQPTWKAGTARARITPQEPLWMAGYGGRDHPAEGTLHDIWVKVLAIEDPGAHRAVVITSDVCGFSKASYEAICAGLKERCGLDRDQVMLTYSHTHTGPALRECLQDYYPMDDRQRAANDRYTLALERTIVDKAAEAIGQMSPATLWAGEGTTDFAVNRRNNREAEVPDLLARGEKLRGPVDHRVPVLVVRGPQGELRAVVFGYACHPTTLSFYQWSGDYAGFAQIDLEADRPGVQAMFFMGCGADQNPLLRRSVELCRKYGKMLADAVEAVLREPLRPIAPSLQTRFALVDLDFERTMTRADLEGYAAKGGLYGRWAERMLRQLDAGKTFPKSYPYAVEVWKLGADQLWISLGGEAVVDYSLKFRAKYGPHTWVNGFAHDLTAYIPSRRVWDEGGYEGGALGEYGLPAMRWAPDAEDRITASVEKLVAGLK
jgi:neutral ceramidase